MKRGTVREDGKVFCRISKGKEIWLTKEKYEERENKRKEYVRQCQELYKKYRKEKRKFGECDYKRNLYFIGISSSGKEIWRNKAFLEKRKRQHNLRKKEYNKRCLELPQTNLKFGDPHPENSNLFVVHKIGNKCFFGTKSKLKKVKESKRMTYAKRYFKSKKKRNEILKNKIERKKRGEIRIEDNKVFWEYNRVGKEIWLDHEIFHLKRNKEIERRKSYRNKRKLAILEQATINEERQ
jgi:hypothetical protein